MRSVGGDGGKVSTDSASGNLAFEVVLGVEGGDLAGVGIGVAVEQPHFLAVGEEGERHVEFGGVVAALILRGDGIDAGVLRFERGHGAAGAVAEDVIGAGAVRGGCARRGRWCRR